MVINIDEEQRSVLRSLIEVRLRNLSSEIRHTDSPQMRQALRDEREVLRTLTTTLPPMAEAV